MNYPIPNMRAIFFRKDGQKSVKKFNMPQGHPEKLKF
jgi:hypothetical protein